MSRRTVARVGASLVALAGLGTAASAAASVRVTASATTVEAPAPFASRSFTIRADAFPIEPAPGTKDTSIGARPAGTRISVSNAPATAYGRAAATDAGTVELYTGPPPAGTVAECDATAPNIARQSAASPAGMQLTASCDSRPSAHVVAAGSGSGVSRSAASGDGGGDALAAEASAVVDDTVAGAIRLGSVAYHGAARTTGRPGGATATGRVDVSDATVAGVPVRIGADGVTVDTSKVPLDLVRAATDAVHQALSQGDYSDVRVVQPATSVAPDGSRAEVSGGGVFFFGQNPDPTNNYFLRLTLAGGSALVAVGGDAGTSPVAAVGDVTSSPRPGALSDIARPGTRRPTSPSDGDSATDSAARAPDAAPAGPAAGPALDLVTTSGTTTLAQTWRGWWWVLVAALVVAGGAVTQRARLAAWWSTTADRYVRG